MSGIDHEARRRLFDEALAAQGVRRCVIVTGSFRAGTSFICSLLGRNGVPGIAQERFSRYRPFRKPDQDGAFAAALARSLSGTRDGLFACKLMWPHRNNLSLALGYGREEAAAFAASFPDAKWINVIRRDKVAQAISFWKAKRTDRWHVRRDEAEPEIAYDFEGIRKAFVELSGHDMLWQDFHARAGTGAHSITYEDFLADVEGNLHELLGVIGDHRLAVDEVQARSPLRRQRNEQSGAFRERFLADFYRTGF